MTLIFIQIACFVAVSALVGGIAMLVLGNKEHEVEDRLALLTSSGGGKPSKDALLKGGVLAHPFENTQSLLMTKLARMGNLNLLLDQADSALTPTQFFGISAVLAIVGMAVPILAGVHPSIALPTGLILTVLPFFWLLFRRKRRLAAFAKQLPEALELMSRALRAGHSLGAGFSLVAEEMRAPINQEFHRVFEEQNLGIPLDAALDNMTERIPNLDLKFFATAVILQRQTGGDLAEILDKIGYLVRERFKIWGQVQALTGEGRLSGIVLLALPPVLFLAVYKLNPEYVTPLFTDPMGRKMLFGGIVMQLLGAVVIRKIINIKV